MITIKTEIKPQRRNNNNDNNESNGRNGLDKPKKDFGFS